VRPTRSATPAPAKDFKPTPRRHHVAHAWVTAETLIELEREANARRVHPDALLAQLLTKIARRKLFGALLDH